MNIFKSRTDGKTYEISFLRAFPQAGEAGEPKAPTPEKHSLPAQERAMPASFISPEILKHLARELDRDTIEEEFSIRVGELKHNWHTNSHRINTHKNKNIISK